MSTDLIPLESVNAREIFAGDKLDQLLERIRSEAASLVPDVTTDKGRKEIASTAYKVARSKTTIDEAGKELVGEWKRQAGEVDAARRKARDYLDNLRDEIRAPLTAWEEEQDRIAREKAEAEARAAAEAEAARIAEIERREAELREREEAVRRAEEQERRRREAEEAEQRRKAAEEQMRQEAEERAQREAAEQVERERLARESAERAAAEAELRRARESAEAAERERQAALRAEQELQEAVRQAEECARQKAEDREQARLRQEEAERQAKAKRAADIAHRNAVNKAAIDTLVEIGVPEKNAVLAITAIASGGVPAVSITY